MRDMLERLQTISADREDDESEFYGAEHDVDEISLSQQAVVFENSAIDDILKETHSIRKEISSLHSEVQSLSSVNERFKTSVRRLTLLKKDSDSIARRIQQRGEALYIRLQALGKESSRLEEKEGYHSAISRIARVQYDTLTRAFHDTMNDYSRAEEMLRSNCRRRIQRQASIIGTEITDNQLDELVDKGCEGWAELSHSLQTQAPGGGSCHSAMCEIKGRHKELVELEARLKEVHELFQDMAMMVEEQGSMINNIENNVCCTEEYVQKINVCMKKAIECKKKNPFLQCCPCLPCWGNNKIF